MIPFIKFAVLTAYREVYMAENEVLSKAEAEGQDIDLETGTAQGDIKHLDFITALVLMAVCIVVSIVAYGYYIDSKKAFYASPGFMPILIAGMLFLMSLSLLLQSLKGSSVRKNFRRVVEAIPRGLKSARFKNSIIALGLFAIYIYGMLRFIPFWLSSLILLFVSFVYLKASKLVLCAVIAILSVGGIVLLFQVAFHVPMP